jgi:hypothetical protein
MTSKGAAARDRQGKRFLGPSPGLSADAAHDIAAASGDLLADVFAFYITDPRTGQ